MSPHLSPELPRSSQPGRLCTGPSTEPILVPMIRIHLVDFPWLRSLVRLRLTTSETCCGVRYGPEGQGRPLFFEDEMRMRPFADFPMGLTHNRTPCQAQKSVGPVFLRELIGIHPSTPRVLFSVDRQGGGFPPAGQRVPRMSFTATVKRRSTHGMLARPGFGHTRTHLLKLLRPRAGEPISAWDPDRVGLSPRAPSHGFGDLFGQPANNEGSKTPLAVAHAPRFRTERVGMYPAAPAHYPIGTFQIDSLPLHSATGYYRGRSALHTETFST